MCFSGLLIHFLQQRKNSDTVSFGDGFNNCSEKVKRSYNSIVPTQGWIGGGGGGVGGGGGGGAPPPPPPPPPNDFEQPLPLIYKALTLL